MQNKVQSCHKLKKKNCFSTRLDSRGVQPNARTEGMDDV